MRLAILVLTVGSLLGCSSPTVPAIPQIVVGDSDPNAQRITFVAPDGFEWNQERSIWYNKQLRTSVSPSHNLETTLQVIVDDFQEERCLANGLELVSKETRDVDGRPTLLVHCKRLKAKYPQNMCVVAFGTDPGCIQLTAIYPANIDAKVRGIIEASLLNARYDPPKSAMNE